MISMATFNPVKKWLIPLTAMIVGLSLGYLFFPSSQDYHYQQLMKLIDEQSSQSFETEAAYFFDGQEALTADGYWSKELTYFGVATPVSDNSSFHFDIYMESDHFYVESDGAWTQASIPHSIIAQMEPLDDPFTWAKKFLQNADQLLYSKTKDEKIYTGLFDKFTNTDFMGYRLKDQQDSQLSFVFSEGVLERIHINVEPIRPDDIGTLQRYPEQMEYQIDFTKTLHPPPVIPKEAREAEFLD